MANTPASSAADPQPVLDNLTRGIRTALGENLLGLYLWGSYVLGDFNPRISDLDLIALLARDVNESEFQALRSMHDDLARNYPAWSGRIEVAYATVATLNDPAASGEIVRISPGEPLNRRRSDERWRVDWYVAREHGTALYGPPLAALLAPISRAQFVASVRANIAGQGDWLDHLHGRSGQAYAILLMCRALRATLHGDQLSKPAAGRWAQTQLPEWAGLIGRAIAWREAAEWEPRAPADDETRRFVEDVRRRILVADKPAITAPAVE